jgi:parvulin-like peptidyl-prolyl isomerase
MRFSMRTLLLAAATALVAGACSSGSVVATVDGAPIDNESVVVLRTSFMEGTDYDGEAYRVDLTNLIYMQAQKNAAESDFGLTGLDDPDRVAAKIANPTAAEAQIFTAVASTPDRTEATADVVAEQLIIRDEVTAKLADDTEYLTDIYENRPEMLTAVCMRHILTATLDEAQAVKSRLEAGEDFAAVAGDASLDTSSPGGQLPCPSAAGDFVPEMSTVASTAPLGEYTEPVQSQYGWHVMIVDERTSPGSLDELLADPLAYLPQSLVSSLWASWIDKAVRNADVEVASQVGTWGYDALGILPPPAG